MHEQLWDEFLTTGAWFGAAQVSVGWAIVACAGGVLVTVCLRPWCQRAFVVYRDFATWSAARERQRQIEEEKRAQMAEFELVARAVQAARAKAAQARRVSAAPSAESSAAPSEATVEVTLRDLEPLNEDEAATNVVLSLPASARRRRPLPSAVDLNAVRQHLRVRRGAS